MMCDEGTGFTPTTVRACGTRPNPTVRTSGSRRPFNVFKQQIQEVVNGGI